MVALQAAIGVTNDLVDAERDAGRPDKPLADGRLSRGAAIGLAGVAAGAGLLLAALAGAATLFLAGLILGIGLVYDLALKGTPWSWLPFALGIPVLPAFAWVGATGVLPPGYVVLAPAAFVAGAALAVGNMVADVERDAAAGVATIATEWGRLRAWTVHLGLLVAALLGVALGLAVLGGGRLGAGFVAPEGGLFALGAGSALVGAFLLHPERRGSVGHRVSWEIEAIGVAVAGAGWVTAMVL